MYSEDRYWLRRWRPPAVRWTSLIGCIPCTPTSCDPVTGKSPILYEVDRKRDGRSFTTRRVVAIQHGRAIFDMALSWHKSEAGLAHALPMPDVPPPEALRGDREAFLAYALEQPELKRFAFRFEAIDSRQVERIPMSDNDPHPPYKHTWLKARDPLPDDPALHLALLAYMSDLDFMSTSLLPHGRNGLRGNIRGRKPRSLAVVSPAIPCR